MNGKTGVVVFIKDFLLQVVMNNQTGMFELS